VSDETIMPIAGYRQITKDTLTVDADLQAALNSAASLVDEHCKRSFLYGQFTETLYVYRTGVCYPTNTPVDTVSTPSGLAPQSIQGAGIYLGVFLPVPALVNAGDWMGAIPPQTVVTYMGGFQPYGTTDGPTAQVPQKVARAIARVAWLILHPVALVGMPVGATSASIGGLSVAGDLSPFIAMDSSIERDLKGYRKRMVRGWQRA